jgi:hypothetical protein
METQVQTAVSRVLVAQHSMAAALHERRAKSHLLAHLGESLCSGTLRQQAQPLVVQPLNYLVTVWLDGAVTGEFVETAVRQTAGLTTLLAAAAAVAADSPMHVFLMLEEKAAAGLALLTLRLCVLLSMYISPLEMV